MFERFTESARRAIVLSQGEARALKQDHVGPHHLLLGVLTAENTTAGAVLASLGVDAADVRREAIAKYGNGEDEPPGHIQFSQDGKKALENSLRESMRLGHNYIGTEHIVLGLIKNPSEETAELLAAVGADADAVQDAIMARLGAAGGAEPAEP
jgi:ATP-dependent Clp protease ATP-binding subunit ClpA